MFQRIGYCSWKNAGCKERFAVRGRLLVVLGLTGGPGGAFYQEVFAPNFMTRLIQFKTVMILAMPALLFVVHPALHGVTEDQGIGTIRVAVPEGDERVHRGIPVSVELPDDFPFWRPWRLLDAVDPDRSPASLQLEPGSPRSGWFILPGEIASGEVREFRVVPGPPVSENPVAIEVGVEDARLTRDGETVLRYWHSPPAPPEGYSDLYLRSGFIHPVYSPDGRMVTDSFPPDHPHHMGVWTAWTRTRFEDRQVDFWNAHVEQGTVRFAAFDTFFAGPVFAGFKARHEHVDFTAPGGEKVALDEVWDVRAWAAGDGERAYRLWDLEARQTPASDSPLELLEYHYGGLGFRGARDWVDGNHRLLSSEGRVKSDAHATEARWVAHNGEIDGGEATVVMLVHPENYRFPTPMRVWESGGSFFCWAPVQAGGWTLAPGDEEIMRYRFLVHDGPIDGDWAENAWHAYANPPTATFTPAAVAGE